VAKGLVHPSTVEKVSSLEPCDLGGERWEGRLLGGVGACVCA
jgi:hypothetical protein